VLASLWLDHRPAGLDIFLGQHCRKACGMKTEQKRHRHERNMWVIAGGYWLWCYQCGAIRLASAHGKKWDKPTGIGGINPAMKERT